MGATRFKQLTGRAPQRVHPFQVLVSRATPKPLPREGLDQWWHPDREGAEPAPAHVQRDLHDINPLLAICRPPPRAPLTKALAWLVWMRKPTVTHVLCPGWLLLFDWRTDDGRALALDHRVYANLYMISARQYGGAMKYFEHCCMEIKRNKARAEKTHQDDRKDHQKDYQRYLGVKNIGMGNKFAQHHDGTIIPSKGSVAWHLQNRRHVIPGSVAKDEAEAREKRMDFLSKR